MRISDWSSDVCSSDLPVSPRDSARMLVVRPDTIEDCVVTDLAGLLRPGDVLVFNDARVIPAQLEGRRGEAKVGATLHKREGPREWRAFIRNAKRGRDQDRMDFGEGVRSGGHPSGPQPLLRITASATSM